MTEHERFVQAKLTDLIATLDHLAELEAKRQREHRARLKMMDKIIDGLHARNVRIDRMMQDDDDQWWRTGSPPPFQCGEDKE